MNRQILPWVAVLLLAIVPACAQNRDMMEAAARQKQMEKANLEMFDDLDFNVFSRQEWDSLGKSHASNIKVHWPDGRMTEGLEAHIQDLEAMFVYAPDTRIDEHPIRIASGEWTAVQGILEGTFTQPMPGPNGTTIAPTGKSFRLPMVTIGRWENGVMVEEHLFWDNQAFLKQIGVVPAP